VPRADCGGGRVLPSWYTPARPTGMADLLDVLRIVTSRLDLAGVPYMVSGCWRSATTLSLG